MPRAGECLFKRRGSQNWWIRFQYPDRVPPDPKKVELSLGTPDRTEAEIRALPLIHAHKTKVLIRRGTRVERLRLGKFEPDYQPGREHHTQDGQRLLATADQLFFLDEGGKIVRTERNGRAARWRGFTPSEQREIETILPKPKGGDKDQGVLELWIKQRNISPYEQAKARAVYATFKQLVQGKSFANCSRDDGRTLVQHLLAQGLKRATIQKHVGYLGAAVNLAMDEKNASIKFNPFSKVMPDGDDALDRLPLDEADMALMRTHLDKLTPEERLLWIWLANTGMRLSEPCAITEEFSEGGARFVIVGSKTNSSRRRVPIPEAVLPLLPAKITGPLFTDGAKHLGRRIMRHMRRIGINDERKVLHCLRHRAKDRLRAAGCPQDIQYHLLGHEKRTVADGYGTGYPVPVLKEWMEKIGW